MATTTTARQIRHFIGGVFVDGSEADPLERRAPGTDEVVSVVQAGGPEQVAGAVEAARKAFEQGSWPRMTGLARSRVLQRVADLIEHDAVRLAALDAEETGKPIRLAEGDVAGAVGLWRYAASLAMTMHGETYTNHGPDFTGLVLREPVGVVGLIVPWNFPLLILSQKLPFALAAGCTAVVKPSELTSSTAAALMPLLAEAGLPNGVVGLVVGDGRAGQAIAESTGIALVSFTGSTATGRKVIAASAGNIKKLSLELGGNAANLVFADADLEDAAAGVVFGVNFNNGECCVSQPRLLVEQSIADTFVREVVRRTRALKVGQPLERATDVGALIHAGHLEKVTSYVQRAGAAGGDIVAGGTRLLGSEFGSGQFIAPTVIDRVEPGTPAFQDEIFGPVLTVTRFATRDEAVKLANAVPQGLANSVWSKNVDTVLEVSRALKSGTVYANTSIDAPSQMPFGGYKASGYGREMGEAGFEEFTALKSVNLRTGKRAGTFAIPSAS